MSRHKFKKIHLKSEYINSDYISVGNSKSTGAPFIQVNSGHQNSTIIHPSYKELQDIIDAIEEILLRRLLGEE